MGRIKRKTTSIMLKNFILILCLLFNLKWIKGEEDICTSAGDLYFCNEVDYLTVPNAKLLDNQEYIRMTAMSGVFVTDECHEAYRRLVCASTFRQCTGTEGSLGTIHKPCLSECEIFHEWCMSSLVGGSCENSYSSLYVSEEEDPDCTKITGVAFEASSQLQLSLTTLYFVMLVFSLSLL